MVVRRALACVAGALLVLGLGAGQASAAPAPACRDDHGNWQYESGGVIAILNDSGCVVTAFTR
jgi:uncharacterized protein (DUF2147 family)